MKKCLSLFLFFFGIISLQAQVPYDLKNIGSNAGYVPTDQVVLKSATVDEAVFQMQIADCQIDVALLSGANDPAWDIDVKNKLLLTGKFSSVDVFYIPSAMPTLAQIQDYDAILVYTDAPLLVTGQLTSLGNLVASYIETGGGVVNSLFATAGIYLKGNFLTSGYDLIIHYAQTQGSPQTLGTIFDPTHPVLEGVTSFNGGTNSFRSTGTTLTAGSVLIANWSDGFPLIVVKENVGPANANRVDLNFYPPSRDARSDFWDPITDGALLMANALVWAAQGCSEPPVIACPPDITVDNNTGQCGAVVNYLLPEITDDGCELPTELPNCEFLGTFGGHNYFLREQNQTWMAAKTAAEADGGKLGVIETAAENDWVFTQVHALYANITYWVGGHQDLGAIETYGGWKWFDGRPIDYTNWNDGEPNNVNGGTENALHIYSSNGKWNDQPEAIGSYSLIEFTCLEPVMIAGLASGSLFPEGNTTVTYKATDVDGNTSECSFNVEVLDAEFPHFGEVGPIHADYYAGNNFTAWKYGESVPKIQNNWGNGSPNEGLIGINYFSIRYTSSFTVPVTGDYKFRAVTDDGFRLYLNNTLIMDYWINQDNPSRETTVFLTAGQMLPLKMEFFEFGGAAEVTLWYTVPGGTEKVFELKSQGLANQVRNTDDGVCSYTAVGKEFDPIFGDNCSDAIVNDFNDAATLAGAIFDKGVTPVKWTVSDDSGHSAEFTFNVTVNDVELPSIECPATITVATDAGLCYATVADLGDPVIDDNCGIEEGSLINNAPADQKYPFGSHTVTWTVYDVNGNSNTCVQTIDVDQVTTVTAVTVVPVSQQYSDLVKFTATITPYECNGTGVVAETVTFFVGDEAVGTADLVNGVAEGTFPLLETEDPYDPEYGAGELSPGEKTVTAVFNDPDDDFIVVDPTTPLTITCEDATVEYTGGIYFTTNPAGVGSIYPEAYVLDAVDGNPGDIRNATVTFRDGSVNGSALGNPNIPVGLIDPDITTEGYASGEFSFELNSAQMSGGGMEWTVWTTVNNYYCGAVTVPIPLTLAMPGPDYVTGGGFTILTDAASGQYPGAEGTKMNFGFVMKWNKSGKSLQGRVNIIYRGPDGFNYQIKSNAINSLIISADADYKMAVITTKANLKRIYPDGTFDDLGGNLTLTMNAWESTEEQTGKLDMISVQLAGVKGAGIYFSSNYEKGRTYVQLLGGGKIQVRDEVVETAEAPKSAQIGLDYQVTEMGMKVYPNPFTDRVTFEFVAPESVNARIDVLDLTGRLVKTVFNNPVEAGVSYTADFEPGSTVSAMYLYRVTLGNEVLNGKILKK